mgnify:CR=1 FL=1
MQHCVGIEAIHAHFDQNNIRWTRIPVDPRDVRIRLQKQIPDVPSSMQTLIDAIRGGAASAVIEALSAVPDLNVLTEEGENAAVACAAVGRHELLARLLNSGASADSQDSTGLSALAVASLNGHCACVQALLQAGATVDLRCGMSESTALMNAAQNGFRSICEALLEAGADPHLQDAYGVSSEEAAHRLESQSRLQVGPPRRA